MLNFSQCLKLLTARLRIQKIMRLLAHVGYFFKLDEWGWSQALVERRHYAFIATLMMSCPDISSGDK